MDKLYYFLIAAISLFLLSAKNHSPPSPTTLDRHCHPQISLCVYCPKHTQQFTNQKAYIVSQGEFAILSSKKRIIFRKKLCREFLNAVDASFTWNSFIQLQQSYKNGQIKLRKVFLHQGKTYFDAVDNFGDIVLFSRDQGSIRPNLYFPSQANQQTIREYARILGWSTFWTILIIATANKLTLNIFQVQIQLFPWIELTTIAFWLSYSYDAQFFDVYAIIKAMILAIIGLNLSAELSNKKWHISIWLIISIFSANIVILGQMYLLVCLLRTFKKKINQIKAVSILIFIDLSLAILSLILSIGLVQYYAMLWGVIVMPMSLLLIQKFTKNTKNK